MSNCGLGERTTQRSGPDSVEGQVDLVLEEPGLADLAGEREHVNGRLVPEREDDVVEAIHAPPKRFHVRTWLTHSGPALDSRNDRSEKGREGR